MRISSLQIFGIANNSIADANEALAKTQTQLSTGRRFLTPADDPVAATKIVQLNQQLARTEQYTNNINVAENNLQQEETTLGSILNLLQRVRELTVQAGNVGPLTSNDYNALSAEIDSRMDELFNLVNTTNVSGDYIFSGYKGKTPAFSGSATEGFNYQGDEGQTNVKISDNTTIPVSDSGKRIFTGIPNTLNSIKTSASPANLSDPPVLISVGQIVDQDAYDDFYPEDLVVSFNAENGITPPGKNFTITERSTGNVLMANEPYLHGNTIEIVGTSFTISGDPISGVAATPATRSFGADNVAVFVPAPVPNFGTTAATFDMTVAGVTETITLQDDVNNITDLVNAVMAVPANLAAMSNLGVTIGASGFSMPGGANITLTNGDARVDAVTGLNTSGGSVSADGVLEKHGDELFIDSADTQDVLTTLVRLSDAMKQFDGSDESSDLVAAVVADTLSNLNNTQTSVLEVTAELGARLNTIESTRALHLDTELVSREILSELQDLDYAEAASRLSAQTLVLEAAQATFVRVSQLSLFNRL